MWWVATAVAQSWPDLRPIPTGEGRNDAAVVVAIEDYLYDGVPPVPGALANAHAWVDWFVDGRQIPSSRVFTALAQEARKEDILELAAKAAAAVPEGGTLWFVFVGHGAPNPKGDDALLLGVDTPPDAKGISSRGASRTEVLLALETGKQGSTIVFLDACFSGKTSPTTFLAPNLGTIYPQYAEASVSARTRLITAASDQDYTGQLVGLGGGRPAFSYLALGAVMGWADVADIGNRDGWVSAEEVTAYIQGAVNLGAQGDNKPTPTLVGSDVRLGKAVVKTAPPVKEIVRPAKVVPVPPLPGPVPPSPRYQCLQRAEEAAEAEGKRRLAEAVQRATERATADWAAAAPEFEACVKLQSELVKVQCEADLERRIAEMRGLTAVVGGDVWTAPASGSCPPQEVALHERREGVVPRELAAAEALLARLKATAETGEWMTHPVLGRLRKVPAGTYPMGGTEDDREKPEHQVTLSAYWIMETEVTQGMWRQVMGTNPSQFAGCDACPVENVSWEEGNAFARKVSGGGVVFRLPTEAEWEVAARGGEDHPYAGSSDVGAVAWYRSNSGEKTHPVCGKVKNGYGLCDMSGNVWEWVSDWKGPYGSGTVTNPQGPSTGSFRVIRGGSWNNDAGYARVAYRDYAGPGVRDSSLGFRLARSNP